jgi:hypothetical protein
MQPVKMNVLSAIQKFSMHKAVWRFMHAVICGKDEMFSGL